MSLALVTFANLGKKANLKTPDVEPIIKSFVDHDELTQIICQVNEGCSFQRTVNANSLFTRSCMRFAEKITGRSFPRRWREVIFDFGARQKLTHVDVCMLHGGYFLPRTLKKAQINESITIDLAVSAHVRTNARLETEELCALGMDEYVGWYTKLASKGSDARGFDYRIVMSDFVKKSYIENGFPAERTFVAAPDVDVKRFVPKEKADSKFRVLYVAYTTPLKGLGYLLDAWRTLQLPDAELVLVGGFGDIPSLLREQYEKHIKEDPSIRQEKSALYPEEYYHQASLLVFPSLTEGFGRVTLEAMACGIPVITTENARGIVEDGKSGFVVPVRDADALAEKIRYLYDNRADLTKMGEAAHTAVECKKPFGDAVYEIYQEIIRREAKS